MMQFSVTYCDVILSYDSRLAESFISSVATFCHLSHTFRDVAKMGDNSKQIIHQVCRINNQNFSVGIYVYKFT